jgi:hypothetical protein
MPRVRYVPMYLNPDQLPVRPNKGLVAVEEFAVLVLQMVDLAAHVRFRVARFVAAASWPCRVAAPPIQSQGHWCASLLRAIIIRYLL